MKNLINWFLTDKKPAFYDCESGTAIEQTARVYKAMQELITEYNKWVESSNKIISDFKSSETQNREVFEIALRQEFQDFINVVDLKTLELEQYIKTNLNASVRKLWDEMTEKGEIQEAFMTTLERIVAIANEQIEGNAQFKNDINTEISTFKNDINRTIDGFTDEVISEMEGNIRADMSLLEDRLGNQMNSLILEKNKVLFDGNAEYGNPYIEISRDILKYRVVEVLVDDYSCLCMVGTNASNTSCIISGFGTSSESSLDAVDLCTAMIFIGEWGTETDNGIITKFGIMGNTSSLWSMTATEPARLNAGGGLPVYKIIGIY